MKPVRKRDAKSAGELAYWRQRVDAEGQLMNHWYKWFYTDCFGLSDADYADARVLDIGCGPRGSLEWADMTAERVGLDPIADDYLELGAADHKMTYVQAGAEAIPFPDGYFDAVFSFNSLDHVDDVDAAISEIKRVTKRAGIFLLLVDIHREPTPQEPIVLDWSVVNDFEPALRAQFVCHYEKGDRGLHVGVKEGKLFDHSDPTDRYGILAARFVAV